MTSSMTTRTRILILLTPSTRDNQDYDPDDTQYNDDDQDFDPASDNNQYDESNRDYNPDDTPYDENNKDPHMEDSYIDEYNEDSQENLDYDEPDSDLTTLDKNGTLYNEDPEEDQPNSDEFDGYKTQSDKNEPESLWAIQESKADTKPTPPQLEDADWESCCDATQDHCQSAQEVHTQFMSNTKPVTEHNETSGQHVDPHALHKQLLALYMEMVQRVPLEPPPLRGHSIPLSDNVLQAGDERDKRQVMSAIRGR
jgi:hypothetical protein